MSSSFLSAPFKYWKATVKFPWSLLLSRLKIPTYSAFPQRRGVPSLWWFLAPSGPTLKLHILLMLEGQELATLMQVMSHESREGQNYLPQPFGHAAPDAALNRQWWMKPRKKNLKKEERLKTIHHGRNSWTSAEIHLNKALSKTDTNTRKYILL